MKDTKKSLILSALSLILCFTMLLGTTFAWFTDEVKSGVNQIVAGNLDVELYHTNKNVAETKVTETTADLFKDVKLWEPGAYAYETFTVKNEGTLALKYKMALNVASYTSYNGHNLTEVIKVATTDTVPTDRTAAAALDYTKLADWKLDDSNNPLYPAQSADDDHPSQKTFTVVLYWAPQDNAIDNLYNMNNGKPQPLSIDLGVKLVATQLEAESDSFGTDYDHDAENEDITPPTPVENEIASADVEKDEENKLKKDTTITASISRISVFAPAGTKLKEDATELKLNVVPKADVTTGVVINDPTLENAISYDISVEGLSPENDVPLTVTVNIGAGDKEVKVYHEGTEMSDSYWDFNSENGDVTISTPTFSPFDIVYSDGIYRLHNAAELKDFAVKVNGGDNYKGKTVFLVSDIDLNNEPWTPIGNSGHKFYGIFDGQNHTISNLKVEGGLENTAANNNRGFFGNIGTSEIQPTIKNIKFHNANVSGSLNVGVVVGGGTTIKEISGIEITGDVKVSGYWYVGSVVGKTYLCSMNDVTVNANEGSFVKGSEESGNIGGVIGWTGEMNNATYYRNISVNNIDVTGTYYVGGILGHLHTNCVLENSSVSNADITGLELVGTFAGRHGAPDFGTVDTDTCTATNVQAQTSIVIEGATPEEQQTALTNAVNNAKAGDVIELVLPAGDFTISGGVAGTTLKIVGATDNEGNPLTQIDNATGATNYKQLAADAEFENVVIVGRTKDANPDASSACGFAHNKYITYKNCVFTGSNTFFNYNCEQNIIDCTFNIDTEGYPLWTYGDGVYNITGCTFNTIGKAIKSYSNGHNTTVNITNCTFNASAANKAAVELDAIGGSINATIEGCVINGSFTTLYNNKGNNPNIIVTEK